ncbi:MAG: response regulator [Desulfobacteraceae bacterium]|jgi:DNA-binding NtrC family response regulator|nr:response regulator [Desulfobacteraceae bacterium]MBC2752938.1 response regulator [Desulfobacteraceae bacterium]
MTVLFVDDEPDFLQTLLKRMRKRSVNASGVGSGEEALVHLAQSPADVVVLDVRMPGMGGIETLRAIKKKTPLTEVVMLTGHASLEVAREGMENGAFDYLMKPVDIDDLLYKIQDAFHKKTIQEAKIKTLNMMLKSESSPTG